MCLISTETMGQVQRVDVVDDLARYNVVWNTPSLDSSGSMPIGNGDIGLNVWAEETGDLLFYIAKTDAWSENCRLLKLGRLRISLSPNPFQKGLPFRQTLKLRQGEIEIKAGEAESRVKLNVWVDANLPVVRVEAESVRPFDISVRFENWRQERRLLEGDELHSAYGLNGDNPDPVYVEPDEIVDGLKDRIIWYHRNERSCYPGTLKLQGLGSLISAFPDPLIYRTFGGCIRGTGLTARENRTLTSTSPQNRFVVSVYPLTAQTETVDEWFGMLNESMAAADKVEIVRSKAVHRMWWINFWSRSWIRAEGSPEAEAVSLGYTLQNWIHACAGRGSYPIKFNGSLFTVDAQVNGNTYDADYRRWGGPYWFQNTRLPYWSMLSAGNFDLMKPLFSMYLDALPMARERTRLYFCHDGAHFPETMYFWGTNTNANYGWNRTDESPGITTNRYIRYEWQGGIEITALMLEYYNYTGDERFLRSMLLPFAHEILTFYDLHYSRDNQGYIRFEPAQALETYWDSVNPLPEIAGLYTVLNNLLVLPEDMTTEEQRSKWRRLLGELPELPVTTVDGEAVLSPAETLGPKNNAENPELYAIFPYKLFGVGKENNECALRSFKNRVHKTTGGWSQDAVQAALLGLTGEAARMVAANFTTKHKDSRFPAFWGPNADWIPDQDHGSVAMIALQHMLVQADGRKILLHPAWPKAWDVHFKLHAPLKTTIEGIVRGGKLEVLKVNPEKRRQDVVVMEPK